MGEAWDRGFQANVAFRLPRGFRSPKRRRGAILVVAGVSGVSNTIPKKIVIGYSVSFEYADRNTFREPSAQSCLPLRPFRVK